ncbi:MAG: hydroxymethylbilane synthase [Rhizomicrobium sp.]
MRTGADAQATSALFHLGSRGSPLALAQSRMVQGMLAAATGQPPNRFPIESFTTSGDRIQDRLLLEAGGKGLFTRELDEALLDRRIDMAIHSMKDLPTRLPDGIVLACVPSREDPRDSFISAVSALAALPRGAVLGTASLRRRAQALYQRPDLKIEMLRGRVETRLQRVADGSIDATFLALAGLTRLGLQERGARIVDSAQMPPAPGQGALAITARADDERILRLLALLNLPHYAIATQAERGFLAALDGSCRTPIGALAIVEGKSLNFVGEALTPDGRRRWRRTASITLGENPSHSAEALGRKLGAEIRAEAGDTYQPQQSIGW